MENLRYIKMPKSKWPFHTVSPQKFYIAIDKSKHADLNTLLLEVPLTFMARFLSPPPLFLEGGDIIQFYYLCSLTLYKIPIDTKISLECQKETRFNLMCAHFVTLAFVAVQRKVKITFLFSVLIITIWAVQICHKLTKLIDPYHIHTTLGVVN